MEKLVLAAYGKLPLSEEYLRHNCFEGWARAVRDWIDQCFDRGSELGRIPQSKSVARRWILQLEDHCVQLAMSPSIDGGGTRRFPFAVFATLGLDSQQQIINPPLWNSLDSIHERLSSAKSTDDFFANARDFELTNCAEVVDEQRSESELKTWVASLYRFDPEDLWVRALWHLEQMRSYLDRPRPADGLLALKLPLSREFDEMQQIQNWSCYLARLHDVYNRHPSVLLPKAGKRPTGVWFFYRTPTAVDFSCALGGELTREEGTDLVDDSSRLPVDGFSEFRKQVLSELESSDRSWREFGSSFEVRTGV